MVHKMILGMGDAMCRLEGGDEGLRVLSSTLGRVVEGGDLDEEDDGYYSSSDEEGEVADAMQWGRRGGWWSRRRSGIRLSPPTS